MKVYKNVKLHLLFGILTILALVIAGVALNLTTIASGVVIGAIALVGGPVLYMFARRIPKHDDNIHFHDRDEYHHHYHKPRSVRS